MRIKHIIKRLLDILFGIAMIVFFVIPAFIPKAREIMEQTEHIGLIFWTIIGIVFIGHMILK